MPSNKQEHQSRNPVIRAIIEIASIIFLFYANLLMGQYTAGQESKTLGAALGSIFTMRSFTIAIVSALIGYVVFEYLRDRY